MNSFKYFKEKNIQKIILGLLILINISVVAVGFVVLFFLPGSEDKNLADTIWESFKILFDPASVLALRLSAIVRVIVAILVLVGIITFTGGSIGYVTNLITDSISNSRDGKGDVSINGGLLFLNWNERAMSIIIDHYKDKNRKSEEDYIVILSKENKVLLEQEINRNISDYQGNAYVKYNEGPRIIVRSGDPESWNDLERVCWYKARAIYIFSPRCTDEADYSVLKTYLALENAIEDRRMSQSRQMNPDEDKTFIPVIIETESEYLNDAIIDYDFGENEEDYEHYYSTFTVNYPSLLGSIYGQIALMPELKNTIEDILSNSGSRIRQFVFRDDPHSIEKDLEDLEFAIPLYDFDMDGINTRIFLSSDEDEEFTRNEGNVVDIPSQYTYKPDFSYDAHRILIIGVNSKVYYILDALIAHNKLEKNNKVKAVLVVTEDLEQEARAIIEDDDYKGLFDQDSLVIIDNWYNIDMYEEYIDQDLHSMLVLSLDGTEEKDTDKNVFETWISFAGKAKEDKAYSEIIKNKVIFEIKNVNNCKFLDNKDGISVVVSNAFTSLFMDQISECEELFIILMDLLSNDYADYEINHADLVSLRASKLFGDEEKRIYKNKRDFIRSVFLSTHKKLIPIGIVRDNTTYIFTNGKNTDPCSALSDAILINESESDVITHTQLEIKPEDFVIIISRNS